MLSTSHMTHDITTAMRLLYGERVMVTSDILKKIQPEELKSIFRQKAFEFHPDRAFILGKNPEEMNEKFKDVKLAYEQLRELLGKSLEGIHIRGDQPSTQSRNRHRNDPSRPWEKHRHARDVHKDRQRSYVPDTHYWKADIPDMRLLFGQFLYYAGLIPWNTLISAITWQRQQRPSFGKIARMWNYLSNDEIRDIISSRAVGEKIGEAALSQGYLTHFQRSAVVGFQKWLQRPIGEFFQEGGILAEEEIVFLIGLMNKHNAKMERMKFF